MDLEVQVNNMERKYGYIKSPRDPRDYKINRSYIEELPERFEVSYSHIKDQLNINSCVAHSVSEILEAQDGINYSTDWIYGYRPDGYYQGEGMITAEALKTVNKVGSLPNDILPGNTEIPDAKIIVENNLDEYVQKAQNNKIISYARLNTINDIKHALYTIKKPVLLAIDVGINGIVLNENNIAYIPDEYVSGHQMVCYGWNEVGFLIQNSWGEDWGDNGTFILPYEYPIVEAWAMYMNNDKPNEQVFVKPKLFWLRKIIAHIKKLFIKKTK